MRKVIALYRNEITKTSRKIFYIVVIAITIAAMILTSLLLKANSYEEDYWDYGEKYSDEYYDEEIKWAKSQKEQYLNDFKNKLAEIEELMKSSGISYDAEKKEYVYPEGSELDIEELFTKAYDIVYNFEIVVTGEVDYQTALFCKEYELGYLYVSSRVDDISSVIGSDFYETSIKRVIVLTAAKEIEAQYKALKLEYPLFFGVYCYETGDKYFTDTFSFAHSEYIDDYKAIIESKDINKYIDLENKMVNEDTSLSDFEKKVTIESNEILRSIYSEDMDSSDWNNIVTWLENLAQGKTILEESKNGNSELTDTELSDYKLQVEEIELALKNKAAGFGGKQTAEMKAYEGILIQVGVMFSKILLIVMASLLIAEEIQSGSVKLLIIAPVKRSKIFLAKVLTLLTCTLLMTVLIYLTLLICNLIMGSSLSPVVYVLGGSAHVMNPYLYYFVYTLISFVGPFMVASFALMISSVVRNSGIAAAGTMIMVFVVDTVARTILSESAKSSYLIRNMVTFLPVFNGDIETKLFASTLNSDEGTTILQLLIGNIGSNDYQNGPVFSLIYTIALAVLFLAIAEQSFEKRDIK